MKTCERCGDGFDCGAEDCKTCWCLGVKAPHEIPAQYRDCLCPHCLRHFAGSAERGSESLIEGEDYYFERGLMVFTREYHLKRGSCCGSGCRNCPYS